MAGIIVADTIQSGGSFIRLNSASQTVATINASGIYANTGNLLIAANGTIGVASITNTAITGTITQAQIGNAVAGTGPAFSVYKGSGNQSFSSSVWSKIQFNTENYDTASCYDNSSNYRFTPNVAGYYIFIVSVLLTAASNPTVSGVALYKNGNPFKYGPVHYFTWTQSGSIQGTYGAYMNGSTDYVEGFVYANATSPSVAENSSQSYFEGYLVRAA